MEKENKYYNYVSFYRGIPVYVGKGVDKRWVHTINGQSGSELINDFYFRAKYLNDMPLDTYIVKRFKTDDQALKGERALINKYLPYCNKCSGRFHETGNVIFDKIVDVSKRLDFDKPEDLYSKFDFRFLFTPKGLLCKNVTLSKNSPFEYAREEYHIRVKKELFPFFPENLLQFMKNDPSLWGTLLTSIHTKPLYFSENTIERGVLFDGLNVSVEWKIDALITGSFDFAEEFGFTFDNYDIGKLRYKMHLMDNHVKDYLNHQKRIVRELQNKEMKQKLKEAKVREEERLREMAKLDGNVRLSPKHDDIRVKLSDKVSSYVEDLGFTFTGCGTWLNLSTTTKPYLSISAMSRYKMFKEDDFLLLNLNRFKKG